MFFLAWARFGRSLLHRRDTNDGVKSPSGLIALPPPPGNEGEDHADAEALLVRHGASGVSGGGAAPAKWETGLSATTTATITYASQHVISRSPAAELLSSVAGWVFMKSPMP